MTNSSIIIAIQIEILTEMDCCTETSEKPSSIVCGKGQPAFGSVSQTSFNHFLLQHLGKPIQEPPFLFCIFGGGLRGIELNKLQCVSIVMKRHRKNTCAFRYTVLVRIHSRDGLDIVFPN